MDVFEALADPVRRRLLERLAVQPSRVADLAADEPVSRPAVSRHLRILGEAGLVDAQPVGRERRYSVRREGLLPLRTWLDDLPDPATPGRRPGGAPGVPPLTPGALAALDTEVRRTSRGRRTEREAGRDMGREIGREMGRGTTQDTTEESA